MWEPGALVLEGRFRVLQASGVTSGTENYVAEQVSLSRKVALRVIRAELGVPDGAAGRFQREVRRIAAVDHPAVVRVIDSGSSEGRLYLVTELVEGTPLGAELKDREPMLPERALDLLTGIAEGLVAVHEKGLVHGELKPQSVVVVGAKARLLDFGVARLLDAESPDERVTVVARTISAPEFLAPEQLKGRDATPASDVYALGVIAYRLLSGELPERERPRPLGGHLASEGALIELVARCLEVDPAKRPSSREVWTKLAKLPRPQEPTLFVEAMQRPPPLPAPEPPPLPAAPEVKQPPKLLESVPMLALTPAPSAAPAVVAAPAEPPRRRPLVPLAIGGAALVVALIGGVVLLLPSPAREARRLIEMRQPAQALEVLTKALRKQGSPELTALRAAALHLSGQHREEEASFKALPPSAKEALDPLVLSGLAEDFGAKEEAGLRAALAALPKAELKDVFEGFAKEPVSMKQWGALRYLDLEGQAKGLPLVKLYSISLESSTCLVRKIAAKRLQLLDDDSALEALRRLRDTPQERDEKACGQEEAASAVRVLEKPR